MSVKEIERKTQITFCCEVEPEWSYGGSKTCPDCGRSNPRTVQRVTIKRTVTGGLSGSKSETERGVDNP